MRAAMHDCTGNFLPHGLLECIVRPHSDEQLRLAARTSSGSWPSEQTATDTIMPAGRSMTIEGFGGPRVRRWPFVGTQPCLP